MVQENVNDVYEAVGKMARAQDRHLINVGCGGTMRVQHLWQSIAPGVAGEAIRETDRLVRQAVRDVIGGKEMNRLMDEQASMPQRFAGLGYRKSANVAQAAYLGGFAMAAYGRYGVGRICPDLRGALDAPQDFQQYPSLKAVCTVWRKATKRQPHRQDQRLRIMAMAAVADTLQTPDARPPGITEVEWGFYKQVFRDKDNGAYETRSKSEHQLGIEGSHGKARAINAEMEKRAVEAFEKLHADGDVTPTQRAMFLHPHRHPGVIKLLWTSGEMKIQRLISRLDANQRFENYVADLPDQRTEARFRGVMNNVNNTPLRTIPSHRKRIMASEEFEWTLNNRIQKGQPSTEEISEQMCSCGKAVGDGRHFRQCRKANGMLRLHDSMRDNLLNMCRSAGLHATREPRHLLRDSEFDRPADILIQNWSIEGFKQRKHAVDCSFPMVDSNWNGQTAAEKETKAKRVGVTAEAQADAKRNHIGSAAEQLERGNSATMTERCRLEGIHFWPVPVEGDGAVSKDFEMLIQNVSDAANKIMGHDRQEFQARWMSTFSIKLAVMSARISIQRSSAEYRRLSRMADNQNEFYGQMGTEVPIQAGVNRSREFRNRMSDLYKSMAVSSAGAPPRG